MIETPMRKNPEKRLDAAWPRMDDLRKREGSMEGAHKGGRVGNEFDFSLTLHRIKKMKK